MDKLSNNQPCPHCGRYNNRAVTIDAVIIKDNKVLAIKHAPEHFNGYWALPGGHTDWNESLEDTVRREIKEELNVEVVSLKQIGICSAPERHPQQFIHIAYKVEIRGEIKAGDDAKEFRWFDINKLPKLAVDHGQIIEEYLKIGHKTI